VRSTDTETDTSVEVSDAVVDVSAS